MNDNTCTPARLCRKWRTCARCARLRQARIADIAEQRARAPFLTWACLDFDPTTKTRLLRSAALRGTGGLWTVEHGVKPGGRGLHLNLLIDSPAAPPPDAGQIARSAPHHNVWAKPVARADVRNVAAYISKRSQFPDQTVYAGRIMGTWGHWRTAFDILTTDADTPPIAQAAAIQHEMHESGILPPPPPPPPPAPPPAPPNVIYSGMPQRKLTRDEYREIAARHLGPLFELLNRKL